MADLRIADTWHLYDRDPSNGRLQVVAWVETGTFVAGMAPGSIAHTVTETRCDRYDGVL